MGRAVVCKPLNIAAFLGNCLRVQNMLAISDSVAILLGRQKSIDTFPKAFLNRPVHRLDNTFEVHGLERNNRNALHFVQKSPQAVLLIELEWYDNFFSSRSSFADKGACSEGSVDDDWNRHLGLEVELSCLVPV